MYQLFALLSPVPQQSDRQMLNVSHLRLRRPEQKSTKGASLDIGVQTYLFSCCIFLQVHTFLNLGTVGCTPEQLGAYLILAFVHDPRIRCCLSVFLATTAVVVNLRACALDQSPSFSLAVATFPVKQSCHVSLMFPTSPCVETVAFFIVV